MKILRSEADFDNAILFQIKVIVWQQDKILDYGGTIEHHTHDSVYINGIYYLKATCEFRVR